VDDFPNPYFSAQAKRGCEEASFSINYERDKEELGELEPRDGTPLTTADGFTLPPDQQQTYFTIVDQHNKNLARDWYSLRPKKPMSVRDVLTFIDDHLPAIDRDFQSAGLGHLEIVRNMDENTALRRRKPAKNS